MFGHVWWPSIILTPDIYLQPLFLRRQGVTCMSPTMLSRSGLHSLIIYFTLLGKSGKDREICKLGDVAYFGEFYKLGENLLLY